MKVCVLEANNKIVVKNIPTKEPLANEAIVQIVSCGICGSDIPRYFSKGAHFYPLVLGHEFYGIVKKIGSQVKDLKPGDNVVGIPLVPCFECDDCKNGNYSLCKNYKFIGSSVNGAYCEELTINSKNLFKIEEEIAGPYCAMFEPSSIGLHAIKMFDGYKGKNVAVVGGGTIGIMVADWARIYGAKNVVVFEQNLKNINTYKTLGINNLVVSDDEGLNKAIKEYTNSKGFDFVFDAAGVNYTIVYSLKLAKNKAKVCFVGTPTKPLSFAVKEWEIINRKELTITGSWMSYSNPFPGSEWFETKEARLKKELVFRKEHFAGFFSIDDIEKAFDFIKNGKNGNSGRVCLITYFGINRFNL